MNSDISQIPLAPIATVVAALIAALISFVNLTLSKEQKTSEFRQAWIDGLRSDLAIFLSSARALCRAMEEARSPRTADEDIQDFKYDKAKVGEMRIAGGNALCRIKLRLNNKETEHNELKRLFEAEIDIQNRLNIEKANDYSEALTVIEKITDYSQDILKKEWVRVKKGEKPYRIAWNLAIAITIVATIFIAFLLLQFSGPQKSADTTPGSDGAKSAVDFSNSKKTN